jgi:hypothetical protein
MIPHKLIFFYNLLCHSLAEKSLSLIICYIIFIIEEETMGLFGPEKITLTLEKYDYTPGDRIKGMVTIQLKKPTKARKLTIALIGRVTEKTRSTTVRIGPSSHSSGHHSSQNTQVFDIYHFELPLDGEKEYLTGQYPVDMKIPENILQQNQQPEGTKLEGTLGVLANVFTNAALNRTYERVDWFVEANLDVPMGLDARVKQGIVLSQKT